MSIYVCLVPKLQYNTSCDSLNICDNNLNFVCNNSICLCSDTTQWNGTSCGIKLIIYIWTQFWLTITNKFYFKFPDTMGTIVIRQVRVGKTEALFVLMIHALVQTLLNTVGIILNWVVVSKTYFLNSLIINI